MHKNNSAPTRTRERIRKALASLLEEKKSLSNITITELTECANVSRSTFYTHYKNLHAVVSDFQAEIFNNFFSHAVAERTPTIDEYFNRLAEFLNDNETIYRQLLSSNEALEYELTLNNSICKQCFHLLRHRNHYPNDHLKISINFFVDGFIGLLTKYFRNELDITLNQIIDYTKEVSHLFLESPLPPSLPPSSPTID